MSAQISRSNLLANIPPYMPSTEIQELLRSNHAPSSALESSFRKAIADSELLAARIEVMKLELISLIREQAQKEPEIRDYKVVLSPIRRLPVETLEQIFFATIPSYLIGTMSLDPSLPLWIIPQLWSHICLSEHDFEDFYPRTGDILATQLERAGQHGLSVTITTPRVIKPSHPLLQVLLPTSNLWTELQALDQSFSSLETFASLQGSLASLKTLELVWGWDSDKELGSEGSAIFDLAPKLTTLRANPLILYRMDLPFSQITHFDSSICTCDFYGPLLFHMPQLQTLTTNCRQKPPGDTTDILWGPLNKLSRVVPRSVRLSHLRRASIKQSQIHKDCILVKSLILPALQELHIDVRTSTLELEALLRRSGCSLKSLSLTLYLTNSEYHNIQAGLVQAIPTLESFTLYIDTDFYRDKKVDQKDVVNVIVQNIIEILAEDPEFVPDLGTIRIMNRWDVDPHKLDQLTALRPSLRVLDRAYRFIQANPYQMISTSDN
ncbi:hypothetical protein C8J56DRAFT_1170870 [Mycena floridula]|nr:hypothetical protein C8J56DRAFT_1170870 [Mycena floridula]